MWLSTHLPLLRIRNLESLAADHADWALLHLSEIGESCVLMGWFLKTLSLTGLTPPATWGSSSCTVSWTSCPQWPTSSALTGQWSSKAFRKSWGPSTYPSNFSNWRTERIKASSMWTTSWYSWWWFPHLCKHYQIHHLFKKKVTQYIFVQKVRLSGTDFAA